MKAIALALAALCCTSFPLHAQDNRAPEISTGWQDKAGWSAQKFMVAAANPLATEAGYQMLKQGGSAVDAAIFGKRNSPSPTSVSRARSASSMAVFVSPP